ncbi:BTAD domain-containing putative transcriptional regulator [Saccharopolyspora sp. NPDC000359]|uniref:BTAD domain-containing putative transcriptional regulator n=1 Tax=Saccharopolyspora sp. NPDC000359 TaxID=3154251 RepID=UPI0033175836
MELAGSAVLNAVVARPDRLRLAAAEDRCDAETGLGGQACLVAELIDLVAEHPPRKRLVAALKRASSRPVATPRRCLALGHLVGTSCGTASATPGAPRPGADWSQPRSPAERQSRWGRRQT